MSPMLPVEFDGAPAAELCTVRAPKPFDAFAGMTKPAMASKLVPSVRITP